jgi:hypothetical protein
MYSDSCPASDVLRKRTLDGEVLLVEDLRERLARVLHAKMEHLDPTGKYVWERLTERGKVFYRSCVDSMLCSGLVEPTKGRIHQSQPNTLVFPFPIPRP